MAAINSFHLHVNVVPKAETGVRAFGGDAKIKL